MTKKALLRAFFELTSSRGVSFVLKSFTRSSLSRVLIPTCVRTFSVDTTDMERPPASYRSLQELFTRRLRDGARPIDPDPDAVVSPVDGTLSSCDTITAEHTFTVKGQSYSLLQMLGDAETARPYRNGHYLIVYLSPRDYHRIHCPIGGTIVRRRELGRNSHPVNAAGLRWGNRPLSRNHRVITELFVREKRIMLVMVGAICVNTIRITSNTTEPCKGEELAYFSFGSTVVMLFEQGSFIPEPAIKTPQAVRMGMRLGVLCP